MRIKIPELPEINLNEISDDDYLAIDDGKDTYKVSVAFLKTVFSCDKKISAVSDALSERIDNLAKDTDSKHQNILKILSDIAHQIDVINSNLADISKRLNTDERNIKTLQDNLNSLTDKYNEFKTKVEDYMKTTTEDLNNFKTSTNKEFESIKDDLNSFKNTTNTEISNIKETIETNKKETDDAITIVDKRLDEKIDRIHNELLTLIDSYHHETH